MMGLNLSLHGGFNATVSSVETVVCWGATCATSYSSIKCINR